MSTTSLDYLWIPEGPWISVGPGEAERTKWVPSYIYASATNSDVCVRKLRGWKMRTYEGLMSEFGAAFQFFDEFGENWPALADCLSSLDEWLPASAYVIVVERAEEVLVDDPLDLEAFLRALTTAAETWAEPVVTPTQYARPAVPFHVLLNISEGSSGEVERFRRAAALARTQIPIRVVST